MMYSSVPTCPTVAHFICLILKLNSPPLNLWLKIRLLKSSGALVPYYGTSTNQNINTFKDFDLDSLNKHWNTCSGEPPEAHWLPWWWASAECCCTISPDSFSFETFHWIFFKQPLIVGIPSAQIIWIWVKWCDKAESYEVIKSVSSTPSSVGHPQLWLQCWGRKGTIQSRIPF